MAHADGLGLSEHRAEDRLLGPSEGSHSPSSFLEYVSVISLSSAGVFAIDAIISSPPLAHNTSSLGTADGSMDMI